jgi:N-glycosylase/DNA lyase
MTFIVLIITKSLLSYKLVTKKEEIVLTLATYFQHFTDLINLMPHLESKFIQFIDIAQKVGDYTRPRLCVCVCV